MHLDILVASVIKDIKMLNYKCPVRRCLSSRSGRRRWIPLSNENEDCDLTE